ncbi:MAG: hypothetical protein A2499_16315 [Stygiobacter sp. RIFOXYC12_FULL_38_8]|nr:MAG: hypothetical protein A2237_10370 [Stygiobacter sp. RIFOXYA2_FULL_38_8]OGV12460.1 MAG: hypothetical protein A2440_14490 [Stygiobacter sp. RIFOXYC2_FULL_38_25]OGV24089.1 MAG: hypothetical protein A2499_16315 [Stygiobacter sp. RIFOXYC12_FULL_38_8]OGV78723.1 MAG: hypothetical protein A2X65_08655 [Stygiobacter sp. GWF2_38_21]
MKNNLHVLRAERRLPQDDLAKLLEVAERTIIHMLLSVNFANLFSQRFALSAVKAFPPLADAKDVKFSQITQSEDI